MQVYIPAAIAALAAILAAMVTQFFNLRGAKHAASAQREQLRLTQEHVDHADRVRYQRALRDERRQHLTVLYQDLFRASTAFVGATYPLMSTPKDETDDGYVDRINKVAQDCHGALTEIERVQPLLLIEEDARAVVENVTLLAGSVSVLQTAASSHHISLEARSPGLQQAAQNLQRCHDDFLSRHQALRESIYASLRVLRLPL